MWMVRNKKNCILNHYYYERFPRKKILLIIIAHKIDDLFWKSSKNSNNYRRMFFFSWFGRIRFDLFSIKTIVAAAALDPGLLYHFYTTTSSKGHSDKILVFSAFLTFKQIAADLAKF